MKKAAGYDTNSLLHFQDIIGRAIKKFTQSGKDSKVNPRYLVLAIIIELCPLQLAGFTDLILADVLLF